MPDRTRRGRFCRSDWIARPVPIPPRSSRCITRPRGGELRGVVLEDEAGDGVAGGAHGELARAASACVLELLTINCDVSADVARDEADHELAGKRPVLAADVLDVVDVNADLFLDLTPHRALQRFAVVDEAGDERVAAGRPLRLAREQAAVAVPDENDDGGMQVRIVLVAALRAPLAPFTRDPLGALAAARAMAARALPPQRLHGHAAEREQIVGQPRALHRHEGLATETRRQRCFARQRRDPARDVLVRAEPERL